ncbi:MAG: hypothetical protein Q9193_003772 [Seirophora villosa]
MTTSACDRPTKITNYKGLDYLGWDYTLPPRVGGVISKSISNRLAASPIGDEISITPRTGTGGPFSLQSFFFACGSKTAVVATANRCDVTVKGFDELGALIARAELEFVPPVEVLTSVEMVKATMPEEFNGRFSKVTFEYSGRLAQELLVDDMAYKLYF